MRQLSFDLHTYGQRRAYLSLKNSIGLTSCPYLFFFLASLSLTAFMASRQTSRPLLRLNFTKAASLNVNASSRRYLITASQRQKDPQLRLSRALIKPALSSITLQQSFRRSYADLVAPKPKRRIRTTLRWLWRLTYLSAIGGIVWTGYTIYQLRTPEEQLEADPNKKTLVILGMFWSIALLGINVDIF